MKLTFSPTWFTGKTLVNYLLMGLVFIACFVNSLPFINPSGSNGLSEGHFGSIDKNPSSSSSIIVLLQLGRPAAIFRGVHAVDIQSVKGASLGPLTHVLGERFKTVLPPFANLNASTSVIMEVRRIFIEASCFHAIPTFISLSPFRGSGFSMLLSKKTPAALNVSPFHVWKKSFAFISTLTKTCDKGCFF